MSTYVAIANRAAMAVGTAARLTAPTDDTVLGRSVQAVWDLERRAALRDAGWNFAIKRAVLPKLTAAPVFGYDSQFQLPADCLKLIEVYGADRLRYQIEGRQILADQAGALEIRYLRDVTEPAEFDSLFAHSFALRIAAAIGNKIAGSAFSRDATWREYLLSLSDAKMADAVENPPIGHEESEWVTSRFEGQDRFYLSGWVDGG